MSTLTVETGQGRISYRDTGSGPPVLLLHSLLTDGSAFDRIQLPGRVIAMDLPGFGETTPAPADLDEYGHRATDLIAALDLSRPTVIGNGLGAFVALATAIHHGDLLGRLVLIGCGARFPEPARATFEGMAAAAAKDGMSAVIPTALRSIFTEDYIATHPEMAAERAEVLRRTDPKAFVTACRALAGLDYRVAAKGVGNPTLIVVGENDAATPPAMAEELTGLLPKATLVRLPGVAHAPQIQDPEGFMRAVTPFLEERR